MARVTDTTHAQLRALAGYDIFVDVHKEAFDNAVRELIEKAADAQKVLEQNRLYRYADETAPIGAPITAHAAATIIRDCADRVGRYES